MTLLMFRACGVPFSLFDDLGLLKYGGYSGGQPCFLLWERMFLGAQKCARKICIWVESRPVYPMLQGSAWVTVRMFA
jgi:hypothetical protein